MDELPREAQNLLDASAAQLARLLDDGVQIEFSRPRFGRAGRLRAVVRDEQGSQELALLEALDRLSA